ncbi:hypothetical protein PVAND_008116 [Polypedilum vanderplanki]|uniref:U2 snRNP-associated SURP motif-containing protein n=1 Tax=Polypedilum vanderplanki TaxID=319348 RepID=A0A9J6C9K3_POLVA|nr:hypothetical protein PVAND_008116 [Polypedilum vanderplanki]
MSKLSKRELEEKRRREIEEENAKAFEDFYETFQNTSNSAASKVWIKAGTYDAGSRKEDTKEKGKLYKPTPKAGTSHDDNSASSAQEYARMLATSDSRKEITPLGKKKAQEKKKSNLEMFKEELKQMQEEREERHKYKHAAKSMMQMQIHSVLEHPEPIYREVQESQGSFDTGDPTTTNLYLGNLNPKITEQQLMEIFGKYGPLASVKIMWPRSDEEKARGRNCGFVAFMARKDAERALRRLAGKDVMGYEMKLGWGKSVPIMTHPIYIPPKLQEYAMPPQKSGLPFNAQPLGDVTNINVDELDFKSYLVDEEKKKQIDEILSKTIVKVVIPTERPLLMLIHRMIEFVIREGPIFESMIMAREQNNPNFRFLFEFDSAAHIYYRWKLFSLLQGDTPLEWSEKEFRMFKNSSIWQPPKVCQFSQGMPEELISDDELLEPCKGQLSVAQRNRLEDLIRHLTPDRSKIGDAMVFCIEHADAADEICDCIAESLTNPQTAIHKKIARIYLVSDILHNCTVKVQNASFFRKSMEKNLIEMFKGLHDSYKLLESRLKAEGFKVRIMKIFRTWEEWAVYSRDFLIKLQNTFLGVAITENTGNSGHQLSDKEEDEDLDGMPLDGAALLKGALMRGIRTPEHSENENEDDIDGVPLVDENIDGVPLLAPSTTAAATDSSSAGFVKSKWEELDPEQVAHQAITTSKWEFDPIAPEPPKISSICDYGNSESESSESETEEKRRRLREIELKICKYQDELESGERQMKRGYTVQEQVESYRRKLLRKSERHDSDSQSTSDRYQSSSSKRERSRRSRSSSNERRVKKSRKSSSSEREKYYSSSSKISKSPSSSSKSKHPKRSGRSRSKDSLSNSPSYSSSRKSHKSKYKY